LEVFEPVGLLESIKVERQVDEPDFPTIWDLKIRILDPSLLPFPKIFKLRVIRKYVAHDEKTRPGSLSLSEFGSDVTFLFWEQIFEYFQFSEVIFPLIDPGRPISSQAMGKRDPSQY
jgi:hypothetical protein